jgi:TRAP-type C4-dicarboxylate transport system substrate-binding protein
MIRKLLVLVAVLALTLGASRTASADEEIKLGTLAPADSAWGKVFKAWSKAVHDDNAAVKLTWYFNGTQGDEIAMVKKVKSGQIDGGAFTATGLSQIYPSVIALQMPGLFPNWDRLDAVRAKLYLTSAAYSAAPPDAQKASVFTKAFADAGFVTLGTGDVGIAHFMSRGQAVHVPDDLKKLHPFSIDGDAIGEKFLQIVGVAGAPKLGVPAILPALSSRSEGAVDVINSPCIAAEQLQWAAQLDNINTMASGIGIGALVMSKARYDALPADVRALIDRTGLNAGGLLTKRIRGIDEAAFNRMKGSKTVTTPSAAEQQVWDGIFKRVRESLKSEGKVDGNVYGRVEAAANSG